MFEEKARSDYPGSLGAIMKRPAVQLAAILLLGLLFHLAMSVLIHYSTVDSSTEGLMALNILKGEHPLFFYGQNYLSSIEAHVAAFFFWILGPSELALSLAPIVFYLGWLVGTYFLFRDLLDNQAGLAAALVLAVPGWYTLWFNISSYGGYPGAFCFGTWTIWICLRIAGGRLSPKAEWIHILSLGFLAGIALWTNYQTATYLLVVALLLLPYLIGVRCRPRLPAKFAVAAVLFVIGILPVIISHAKYEYKPIAEWSFSWGYIKHTTRILSDKILPRLLFWHTDAPALVRIGVIALLVIGGALYVRRLVSASGRRERVRLLVPIAFTVIFLIMYLPHSMASLGAPRYLLAPWSMLLFGLLAVPVTLPQRRLRTAAWCLLIIWLSYNAASAFLLAREKAPEKRARLARRSRVVQKARRIGTTNVMMIGGPVFGQSGQVLTFYSNGDINFISVFDPRYQPSAQAAEAAPDTVFACEKSNLEKVKATLHDVGVGYRVEEDPWVCLIHDLTVPREQRRSVLHHDMRITLDGRTSGQGGYLTDRTRETYVKGSYANDTGFTIDLGSKHLIDGLWLTSPDRDGEGLFGGYTISISADGQDYEVVRDVQKRLPVAYTSGNGVYLMGYFGLFECRLDPIPARYVRVRCRPGTTDKSWQISEVFVFETKGTRPTDLEDEVTQISSSIRDLGIDFTVCDRWLSAKLWTLLPHSKGRPPVFPRFNPRHTSTLTSRRVVPRKGIALVPSSAVADECTALLRELYGDQVIAQRTDLSNYTILVLDDTDSSEKKVTELIWNGHTLLKTSDPQEGIYSDSTH
jgi:hypothetical protein